MRGGYKCLGRAQRNNRSGLPGIVFKAQTKRGRKTAQRVIVVSVGLHRFTRGTTLRGVREAMEDAIELRESAGLPAPTLNVALRKWREFWRERE